MPDIEDELVKATKFKGDKYTDRQEYLQALLEAMDNKLTDDDYDLLSDQAVNWHKGAVKAVRDKTEIPEFDGTTTNAEDEGTDEAESDTQTDDEVTQDNGGVVEAAERAENEATPAKTKGKKKDKPGNAPVAGKPSKRQPDYNSLTGEKDRFGIVIGTKTHEAVKMYEKGATLRQITDEIGGRFYNILKKLAKDGHVIEKIEGGIWKVIHKDDFGKKAKGK